MSMELPEHLRTGPLADAAKQALEQAANMAAASNSVPRISLRGREFRLNESGEEVAKFRDSLDVIIVGVEPEAGMMIKTWYKDGYKSGAKEPPTCSSDDGIAPAPWVTDKQSTQCRSCPKNVFGSATSPSGKPTKACRDSKRVWLKLAGSNELGGKPYGPAQAPFADRTLYGLNVSVASLKSFSDHGRKLTSLGQGPSVCVTKLKMLDLEYPQLEFEIAAWLDAELAPQSLKLANERPWKIQYKNAGLALAMGESAGAGVAKTQLPLAVPAHLQAMAQPTATPAPLPEGVTDAVQAQPPVAPPAADIDDAIGKW